MLASGVLFQLPLAVIGLNQTGILSTRQLRENRRYAIVAIVALAMLLPGPDPVTTLLELIPMLVLFELSLIVATVLERRGRRR
jgi:sec-independent protein translocase protein TatC